MSDLVPCILQMRKVSNVKADLYFDRIVCVYDPAGRRPAYLPAHHDIPKMILPWLMSVFVRRSKLIPKIYGHPIEAVLRKLTHYSLHVMILPNLIVSNNLG